MHRIERDMVVPFFDLDPMQVVWHGHYYKYMELARTELPSIDLYQNDGSHPSARRPTRRSSEGADPPSQTSIRVGAGRTTMPS